MKQIKNKDYSKWLKLLIVILCTFASVLKWFGILGAATITEIWQVGAMAYAVSLGTMDLNIIIDTFKERKNDVNPVREQVSRD